MPTSLRAEKLALTRARIIEAAVVGFAPWSPEMDFDRIAKRAGVSVRTVYRHFPTHRDLFDAVTAHIIQHSGWNPDEMDADNLGAVTRRAMAYFGSLMEAGEHEPEAQTPDMNALRAKRLETIERVVGPLTEGMDPDEARGILAVIAGLSRMPFMRGMVEHWGLDGAQSGRAVEWAINVLLDELRRREGE